MSNQSESTSTCTTLEIDLPTLLHVAATFESTALRAFGALAAAAILLHNIDWAEFRKDPAYQEYAELYQKLLNDIGISIESGIGHSDFDDDDLDDDDGDDTKGGAA